MLSNMGAFTYLFYLLQFIYNFFQRRKNSLQETVEKAVPQPLREVRNFERHTVKIASEV